MTNGILVVMLNIWTYVYKGDAFYSAGILVFRIFQKEISRYMYIPYKRGHASHAINNYTFVELKRYI